MAHTRKFRSSFRGGQRRKKTWVQAMATIGSGSTLQPLIVVPTVGPPAVDAFARIVDIFIPGSPDNNQIPTESTVLRIRGQLNVEKSTAAGLTIGFGICVMDLPQVPADSDDLPGPLSSPEWDGWMFMRGPSEFAPLDVNATQYDVKAMRKVEGGQRLAFVSEVYSDDGVGAGNITYSARVLLALP